MGNRPDPRETITLGVAVDRPWQAVYDAIWRPERFPRWASGLSRTTLSPDGDAWRAEGETGSIRIRFTGRNAFGVMDHWVEIAPDTTVYVPMRVLQNGDGAEIVLTLIRQPGMSASKFVDDQVWVRRDLDALKALLESDSLTAAT